MSTQTASQDQAYLDAVKVLERYKTEGVSREESDAFLQAAIDDLQKGNTDEFAENVAKVSDSAIAVDEAFDRVKRGLSDLVDKFGGDFPDLKAYLNEWNGYDQVSSSSAQLFSDHTHRTIAMGYAPQPLTRCSLRARGNFEK
jgi:ABC-type transporter Mla subunit MlaD